jgi:hypothetical protein
MNATQTHQHNLTAREREKMQMSVAAEMYQDTNKSVQPEMTGSQTIRRLRQKAESNVSRITEHCSSTEQVRKTGRNALRLDCRLL